MDAQDSGLLYDVEIPILGIEPHYSNHVAAIQNEKLQGLHAIAAQLAMRDFSLVLVERRWVEAAEQRDALRKEVEVLQRWRDLARQFENYGAQAAGHLKTLTAPAVPSWAVEGAKRFLAQKPPYPD